MLIHHAKAECVGIGRTIDRRLSSIDNEAAVVRPVVTQQAFHQGGLAGAVLTKQPMDAAGRDLQRHVLQRVEGAEMLADADGLYADRVCHGRPARKVALSLTAPNTPPCILIICSAAA